MSRKWVVPTVIGVSAFIVGMSVGVKEGRRGEEGGCEVIVGVDGRWRSARGFTVEWVVSQELTGECVLWIGGIDLQGRREVEM